ncbi:hypothetical protein BLEM_1765 [Bifidobacterium lemurum]|uniref:DUF1819 family protein n=1 Tax=Bifidobacterium lemurum TaxID=1603886 RepID=A0A261FN60_9BIFI|nr:DUF1819 family protein [Bifidobacterium lemurum]OZG60569.1 hypothetical protein BLEM_1765 [Bifidobacterium lemurum]QOL34206.1 DUF1819 family protein [Bifidobacterium lemurum]
MASYGAETLQDGRYRLSFTVGGLLVSQGQTIASLLLAECGSRTDMTSNDAVEALESNPNTGVNAALAAEAVEVGEQVVKVRQRAVDENVLSIRTYSASVRTVREVIKRLSALTWQELRHLADEDSPLPDRQALMWVAMCRYYAIVGEFANEVLREHYLLGKATVTHDDYDRFMLDKSLWHPEVDDLSSATIAKLRSNVFKAMFEADLLCKEDDTIRPSLLSREMTSILMRRADSFDFFPMRGTSLA